MEEEKGRGMWRSSMDAATGRLLSNVVVLQVPDVDSGGRLVWPACVLVFVREEKKEEGSKKKIKEIINFLRERKIRVFSLFLLVREINKEEKN